MKVAYRPHATDSALDTIGRPFAISTTFGLEIRKAMLTTERLIRRQRKSRERFELKADEWTKGISRGQGCAICNNPEIYASTPGRGESKSRNHPPPATLA
jgi:hypothetical protein